MKTYYASEQQIQTSIINFLKYKQYKVMRLNSGAIKTAKGGLVRLAEKGTPDIMAYKRCTCCVEDRGTHLLFIEVKRPGNKPTPAQEMMMQELASFGARCIVATSIEDVEKHL